MKLTDKQKEALTALAGVMQEHCFAIHAYGAKIQLLEHSHKGFTTKDIAVNMFSVSDITKLLQEQE